MTTHPKYSPSKKPDQENLAAVYSAFFHAPAPIFVIDRNGIIVDANNAFATRYCQLHSICIGANIFEDMAFLPNPLSLLVERKGVVQKVIDTGIFASLEDFVDGSYLMIGIYPIYGQDGLVEKCFIIAQDITGQKQIEIEHQNTITQLNLTLERLHLGAWTLDLQSEFLQTTDEQARIFGYLKQPKWTLELFFSHIHPEDRVKYEQFYRQLISEPRDWINDYRICRLDGNIRWLRDIGGVLYDRNGKAHQFLGIIQDITEQKIIENELYNNKQRLSQALSATQAGVWEWDLKEQRLYWSNEVYQLFGLEHNEELHTFDYWANHILHPEDRGVTIDVRTQNVTNGDNINQEYRICRPDGSIRWILSRGTAHLDASGYPTHYIGTLIDITEMKQATAERDILQQQLQQSQKMELVGQLAGGIAHDFNNILTAILGNAEIAIQKIEENSPIAENLNNIMHSVTRSAEMVKQLLAFARKQLWNPVIIYFEEEAEKIRSMLTLLITKDIELRWDLKTNHTKLRIDPSNLVQIITNICINSRDAISQYGIITIETALERADQCTELTVAFRNLADDFLRITISDTGCGIDSKTLPHIFEPFFTTKPVGQGTGLGLSMVYGLVKQNGGVITCQSNVGIGTTFNLFFPVIKDFDKTPKTQETLKSDNKHNDLVLLVEDEPSILTTIKSVLETKGFQVLTTPTAEKAIETFKNHPDISLVVSDVLLPKMNGVQMSSEILNMKPETKFIFMSGYSADSFMCDDIIKENTNFISKPFTINDFLRLVDKTCPPPPEFLKYHHKSFF